MNTPPNIQLDHASLNALKDLADEDDPDFFSHLVQKYLETGEKQFQRLADAISAQNYMEIMMIAHQMKSNSASFGAMTLADLCAFLEKSAKEGNMISIEYATHIQNEFSAVRHALQKEISSEKE